VSLDTVDTQSIAYGLAGEDNVVNRSEHGQHNQIGIEAIYNVGSSFLSRGSVGNLSGPEKVHDLVLALTGFEMATINYFGWQLGAITGDEALKIVIETQHESGTRGNSVPIKEAATG
jgi:hypothetical protein